MWPSFQDKVFAPRFSKFWKWLWLYKMFFDFLKMSEWYLVDQDFQISNLCCPSWHAAVFVASRIAQLEWECVVRNNSPEQLRNLLCDHKLQFGGANNLRLVWLQGQHLIDLWCHSRRLVRTSLFLQDNVVCVNEDVLCVNWRVRCSLLKKHVCVLPRWRQLTA